MPEITSEIVEEGLEVREGGQRRVHVADGLLGARKFFVSVTLVGTL